MTVLSVNLPDMKEQQLGQEIRRQREEAGITLRGLAVKLGISAAHLSDIENDRRRPSEKLLLKIAHELRSVGTTVASLELLVTGLDQETRGWAAATPGARAVLRRMLESGRNAEELLRVLDRAFGRKKAAYGRKGLQERKRLPYVR